MRDFLRAIAAALVLVIGGLPVAGVLCASECVAVTSGTASQYSDASTHCHTPEPSDTAALTAVGPTAGCSLLTSGDVATRERAVAPFGSLSLPVPHHLTRAFEFWPRTPSTAAPRPPGRRAAGTPLPLRI